VHQIVSINDLDLFLSKYGDSNKIYPNGRDSRDTENNAERVRVQVTSREKFTIHVEGRNLDTRTQTYSLVVTGCLAQANFPVSPVETSHPSAAPTPSFLPTDSNPESLSTTFGGRLYWNGNMWNILAKQDVTIQTIDFHTYSTGIVNVEVWTKSGPFEGSQKSRNQWENVVRTSLQGRGAGNPTSIPIEKFSRQVHVKAGRYQAFYVTLDRPQLLMSKGNEPGSIIGENQDLVVYKGIANTHSFGKTYSTYVWNGSVMYEQDNAQSKTISTVFDDDTSYQYYGNIFDINTKDEAITVTGMHIHTIATDDVYVEVWTLSGSFKDPETGPGRWTKITSGPVRGMGKGKPTVISSEIFDEVNIPGRSTQAFFVTLFTEQLLYSPGTSSYSNGDLVIQSGSAIGLEGDNYEPRVWNGALLYRK